MRSAQVGSGSKKQTNICCNNCSYVANSSRQGYNLPLLTYAMQALHEPQGERLKPIVAILTPIEGATYHTSEIRNNCQAGPPHDPGLVNDACQASSSI